MVRVPVIPVSYPEESWLLGVLTGQSGGNNGGLDVVHAGENSSTGNNKRDGHQGTCEQRLSSAELIRQPCPGFKIWKI